MAFRSSIRASGRWRAPVVALLLALAAAACCAFSAGPAQGATIYFCPTSGWVRLGTGNGCTAADPGWLLRVSYVQQNSGNHCAVGKQTRDPDSAQVIAAVCAPGYEIYTSTASAISGFARGRNESGGTDSFFGVYYTL